MQASVKAFLSQYVCVWHTMGDAGDATDGGPLHHGVDDHTTVLTITPLCGQLPLVLVIACWCP